MSKILNLIEHASEAHPHFESSRGMDDIENASIEYSLLMEALTTLQNIVHNVESGRFEIIVCDDGEKHPGNVDGARMLIEKIKAFQG